MVTTQDIINAYNQTVGSGTMSEAEFVSRAMNDFGVSANQLADARASLLAPQAIEQITASGSNTPVTVGGVTFQPIFSEQGAGETLQRGPLEQVVAYDPTKTATGQSYAQLSPTGEFLGTRQFKDVDNNILPFLAGAGLLFGGLGAGLMGSNLFGATGSLGLGGAGGAGSSAFGSGAWLGEGIASGVPAWDAAALAAGNTVAGVSPALLDAQFIAADAAQLAAQTGNNVAAIQQNLIAAGVDPIVAATAADAAALGVTGSNLITTIASAGAPGGGLFTGGSLADLALGGISTVTGNNVPVGGGALTTAPPPATTTPPPGTTTPPPGTTNPPPGTTTPPPGRVSDLPGLLSNPNNLSSLLQLLGLLGAGRAISGSGNRPLPATELPTQGLPVNTPAYYQSIQNYYNQFVPGAPRNVSDELRAWYEGTF